MRFGSRGVSRSSAALVGVAIAVAIALAGCGEKEEPETAGPVEPITTTTVAGETQQGGGAGSDQGTQGQDGPDGGSGTPGARPVSDEKAVQDGIEMFLTSPRAEVVCSSLITPELLRRTYGSQAGCRAARKPATLAVSAQISGLQVTGASAKANAKPNGGVNNDERLHFELWREGDQWRIANIRSNARVGP